MKRILLISLCICLIKLTNAQTLQQVTNNGNSTDQPITARYYTAYGSSFGGSIPLHIDNLTGLRINGDIPDISHNAITYQSGGGGGAAMAFFRGGSYDTGIDFYTNDGNVHTPGNLIHRMRISSTGLVGLGTFNPKATLDVGKFLNYGELGSVLARLQEGANSGEGTFLGVRGFDTQGTGEIKSFALEHAFHGNINSAINFYRGGDMSGGFITFSTSNNSEKLRIQADGNVGIGTSSPQEKLSVNGKIRAKEIKVETANWPDYVFEEDYQLPDLKETEDFIKTNKHLPGIPSAKEVEENGVSLGEMNAKLLKKIEELTLHLIVKDKQLNDQSTELKEIKLLLQSIIKDKNKYE